MLWNVVMTLSELSSRMVSNFLALGRETGCRSAMPFVLCMHWNHVAINWTTSWCSDKRNSSPASLGFAQSHLDTGINHVAPLKKRKGFFSLKILWLIDFFGCSQGIYLLHTCRGKEEFVSSFLSLGTQHWDCFSGVGATCELRSWQPRGKQHPH